MHQLEIGSCRAATWVIQTAAVYMIGKLMALSLSMNRYSFKIFLPNSFQRLWRRIVLPSCGSVVEVQKRSNKETSANLLQQGNGSTRYKLKLYTIQCRVDATRSTKDVFCPSVKDTEALIHPDGICSPFIQWDICDTDHSLRLGDSRLRNRLSWRSRKYLLFFAQPELL